MTMISDYIAENLDDREEYLQIVRNILDQKALGAPEGYNGYGHTLMNTTIARLKPWDLEDFFSYDSALNQQALYNVKQMSEMAVEGLGYELGVYNGGVSRMLLDSGRRMVCFDTFEGIRGSEGIDHLEDGEYCTANESAVRELLDGAEIVKGNVMETLQDRKEIVSFVHLDMDIYTPTYFALHNIWPRLRIGGVIMMDDYGVWCTQGIMRAADVFLNIHQEAKTIYFPTGQMAIIK